MTKEQFFANKDKNYEFGVTLGQAFNLAIESLDVHQASDEQIVERVYRLFSLILHTRLKDEFINTFESYYEHKNRKVDTITIT